MATPEAPKERFTGKELDDESDLYYFGARYYDPEVVRWLSIDPLAEKHPDWTPYNYVLGNPLILIDPDGRQVDAIIKTLVLAPQMARDARDLVDGATAAVLDNASLGALDFRREGAARSSNLGAFNLGQDLGDLGSVVIGAVETVQGVALIVGGVTAEGAGFALDATGVGVVVGIPLNLAGAGAIAAGIGLTGYGISTAEGGIVNFASRRGGPSSSRGNLKKLSNQEIKMLEEAGHDIHDLKGGKRTGRTDLYKDGDGNITLHPKGGKGPGEPTGLNIKDIKDSM